MSKVRHPGFRGQRAKLMKARLREIMAARANAEQQPHVEQLRDAPA